MFLMVMPVEGCRSGVIHMFQRGEGQRALQHASGRSQPVCQSPHFFAHAFQCHDFQAVMQIKMDVQR